MSGTQIDRVLTALRSRPWSTLPELAEATGDPVASISAQLRNLRKPEHGAHSIKRRRRSGNLYEYSLGDVGPIEANGDEE